MTSTITARAGTALSPEWDRGFDEAFTEIISGDPDLVREEFDALIGADFGEPPAPPDLPAPPAGPAEPHRPSAGRGRGAPAPATKRIPADPDATGRPPP